MAKYYYSKYRKSSSYNTVQEYVPGRQYLKSSTPYLEFRDWLRGLDLYAKREVDSNGFYFLTGPVTVSNETYGFGFYNNGKYIRYPYIKRGSIIGTLETEGESSGSNSKYSADITDRYETKSVFSHYYRGALIESNIIAESGTYPTNGIQGDYWYVRGSIVPLGTVASIKATGEFKSREEVNVTWSAASRATSYSMDVTYNLSSWISLYNGTGLNYTHLIPKGHKQMQFRIRATGNGQTSAYTYSSVYDIKTFPEMAIKANGSLKISSDGWVKVNNELKEISDIYVKVNGILKEL